MSSDIYVVFERAGKHWWTRFLHSEIQHCYVLQPEKGRWLVQNKTIRDFEVFTVDDISEYIFGNRVVKCKKNARKNALFRPNTCVEYTKAVLGIKKPFIFTAYQLFKYLRGQHEKA